MDDGEDHDEGGSGLGSMVWYQIGRWAAEDDIKQRHFADGLRARFTPAVQRPQGRIYIDDYNNLVEWKKHALYLEKKIDEEWHPAVKNIIAERDYYRNRVEELQDELQATSQELRAEILQLKNENDTGTRTGYINSFLQKRCQDFARFGLYRLGSEPEFLELLSLTAQFLRKYKPENDEAVWPSDLEERIDEVREKLLQKCPKE